MKSVISRFIVSGFSAVFTDLSSYYVLSSFIDLDISKGISFILGTIVAYLLNKYWTFKKKDFSKNELLQFLFLYLLTLSVNILVNRISLEVVVYLTSSEAFPFLRVLSHVRKELAFLAATGTSTILNFLGQKYWVFKK